MDEKEIHTNWSFVYRYKTALVLSLMELAYTSPANKIHDQINYKFVPIPMPKNKSCSKIMIKLEFFVQF